MSQLYRGHSCVHAVGTQWLHGAVIVCEYIYESKYWKKCLDTCVVGLYLHMVLQGYFSLCSDPVDES